MLGYLFKIRIFRELQRYQKANFTKNVLLETL